MRQIHGKCSCGASPHGSESTLVNRCVGGGDGVAKNNKPFLSLPSHVEGQHPDWGEKEVEFESIRKILVRAADTGYSMWRNAQHVRR